MHQRTHWQQLILLALLLTFGLLFGSLASAAFAWSVLGEFPQSTVALVEQMSHTQVRLFISINQIFTFLLPGLLGLYFIKFEDSGYQSRTTIWRYPVFIVWYFVSLPFFQWLFYVNFNLEVPVWWPFQVEAVPDILIEILSNMSFSDLLVNTMVIAIIPAIGEELIFRVLGVSIVEKIFKSGHIAVFITAFIFAIFHFDFQGILPRFLLGILLGYAFLFSRNMWIPIIIHFIHNAGQLLFAYFSPSMVKDLNQNVESPQIQWVITSLLFVSFIFWYLNKTRQRA